MVAVTAVKNYASTSVADLVEASGVSSRSFYEHFRDKEDLFLATMDKIMAITLKGADRALEAGGTATGGADRAVETLVGMAAAQPAAAKLCTVTAFCAGEAARGRIAQAVRELSALLQQALDELPEREVMPEELTRAIFGGISLVVYRRLARDQVEELEEVGVGLREWVVAVPPPPGPLRPKPRRRRAMEKAGPAPLAAHVPAERVLRAFAAVVAEKGYAATTIADVAAKAHISQNTFYRHFKGKADALDAALDSSGAQMLAAALPAIRREPAWPGAVRVALEALCAFMAAEPDFAYLREVEVYAVGPDAVAQRDRAREEIVQLLRTVATPEQEFDRVAVEATLGAFQSLLYGRILEGRLRDLAEVPPLVTYLALAPMLGAEAAYEAACDG